MVDDSKSQGKEKISGIETEIIRLFSQESKNMLEEVQKHRDFLQTQFKMLTWGIGVLFFICAGSFTIIFGKSIPDKIARDVDQKVIEYRIVDKFKEELQGRLEVTIKSTEDKLKSDTAAILEKSTQRIDKIINELASQQVNEKVDKIITSEIEDEIKRIKDENLKNLFERFLPRGIILAWKGSEVSIPSGWVLCDGSNGTPDLRARFLVGAGIDYTTGQTGGSKLNKVSHKHQIENHTHSININTSSPKGNAIDRVKEGKGDNVAGDGHHHNVSGSTKPVSLETNEEAIEIDNRPPFYAICYIMKN